MNPDTIAFGTDGWRAIIADTFTLTNLKRIARAYADYLTIRGEADAGVAVSFDTRFMSDRFALAFAEVLAGNRIRVILSTSYTPTPVLSFSVKHRNLAGGIMITASHNPYYYNGIKFKAAYGGPALPEFTQAVESRIRDTGGHFDKKTAGEYLVYDDLLPDYLRFIETYVDLERIRRYAGHVVFNPMSGAGCGIWERLFSGSPLKYDVINNRPDPVFNNTLPEPILKNLMDLREAVVQNKADIGIATDGDADRFGILDEEGRFVELHDLMPLLFGYLRESRKWDGVAVRTTSMAGTIDKMAARDGFRVIEVPVGFKNVTEKMLTGDVLIGGEESGGFGYKNYIPERDGVLSGLLVLEMLSAKQRKISDLVRELRDRYGPFAYGRIDRHHPLDKLQNTMKHVREKPPQKVGFHSVERISLIDGIKFYFTDDSWMLIRVSQTEPLARIYVGSDSRQSVNQLLEHGVTLITG